MQPRQLIIFILVCIVILFGWGHLQNLIWGPGKPNDQAKQEKKPDKTPPKDKTDKDRKEKAEGPQKTDAKKDQPKEPPKKAEPKPEPVPRTTVTLGQDGTKYHLRVRLTTLGGGVEGLTCTKFAGADDD